MTHKISIKKINNSIESLAQQELIGAFGDWDVTITQTKQSDTEVEFEYEYKLLFNKHLLN